MHKSILFLKAKKRKNSRTDFQEFYETFRISDPFTLTLLSPWYYWPFSRREGGFVPVVAGSITTQRPSPPAVLCMARSFRVKRSLAAATGAAASVGHVQHFCASFLPRRTVCPRAPVTADPMLYSGFLYSCILPATVQSAIAVYFTSPRAVTSRPRCAQRLRPSAGHFPVAAAGRSGNEYSWRAGQSGRGGQNYAATAAAFCAGTPVSPVDRATGSKRATTKVIAKRIRPLFCWWSTRRSAKRCGQRIWHKVGWDRCRLSSWSAFILLAIVTSLTSLSLRKCISIKADEITIVFCGSKSPPTGSRWPIFCSTSVLGMMVLIADDSPPDPTMVCAGAGAALQTRQTEKLQQESRAAKA